MVDYSKLEQQQSSEGRETEVIVEVFPSSSYHNHRDGSSDNDDDNDIDSLCCHGYQSSHRVSPKVVSLLVALVVVTCLELISGGALLRALLHRHDHYNTVINRSSDASSSSSSSSSSLSSSSLLAGSVPIPSDPIALAHMAQDMIKLVDDRDRNKKKKKKIAIGIFTVPRPLPTPEQAATGGTEAAGGVLGQHRHGLLQHMPDYLYIEVMSILDTLMASTPSSLSSSASSSSNSTTDGTSIRERESLLDIDYIHVFDGSPAVIKNNDNNNKETETPEHGKYFRYSPHIQVHHLIADMQSTTNQSIRDDLNQITKGKAFHLMAPHRKASLNYYLALRYLINRYERESEDNSEGKGVDAYLMLEDDLIFDPQAALILYELISILQERDETYWLVDGYVRGFPRSEKEEEESDKMLLRSHHKHITKSDGGESGGERGDVVVGDREKDRRDTDESGLLIPYHGKEHCCSQSFLFSPATAKLALPKIEMSLNGSEAYLPLDLFLTSSLLKLSSATSPSTSSSNNNGNKIDFHYYFAKKCWVQHIGFPYLGLGTFHRGCSRMKFD